MSKRLLFPAIVALALLSVGQPLRAAEDPAPALACNSLCRSWLGLNSSPDAAPAKTAEPIALVPPTPAVASKAAAIQPAKAKTTPAVPPVPNVPLATMAKPRPVPDTVVAQATRKKATLAQAMGQSRLPPKARVAASTSTPRDAVPTLASGAPLPMADIVGPNEPVVAALVSLTKPVDPAPAIALPPPPPVPPPLVVAVAEPAPPVVAPDPPAVTRSVVAPSSPPVEAAAVPKTAPAAPTMAVITPVLSVATLPQHKAYDTAWSPPLDVIGALILDTPPQHQAAR